MEQVINYILLVLGVVFVIAVPLAILGLRLNEGLWGNTICLCNITFASLIAANYFELVSGLLVDAYVKGLFFYDFFSFWVIFALVYFILNFLTNRLSRIKVHFPPVVEQAGNGVVLLAVFLNFACAVGFSLPTAPFAPDEGGWTSWTAGTEGLGYRVRVLSHCSLVPFTGENEWPGADEYVADHTGKRWALMSNALEKKAFMYDGAAPPRRGGTASSE
ncbi:MAG: hypothetical protein ACRC2T_10505 [Thermoguttaceae bacterium]